MCVIIHNQEGKPIEDWVLDKCESINKDGFGITYLDGDFETKHTMDYKAARELLAAERPYVAHYRYTTAGKTCQEMNHPFSVKMVGPSRGSYQLYMNGTIKTLGDDEKSDTAQLAEMLQKIPVKYWPSLFSLSEARFCCVNESTGLVQRYGEWHEHEGVFFSKDNVLKKPYVSTYAGGSTKYSGNSNNYSGTPPTNKGKVWCPIHKQHVWPYQKKKAEEVNAAVKSENAPEKTGNPVEDNTEIDEEVYCPFEKKRVRVDRAADTAAIVCARAESYAIKYSSLGQLAFMLTYYNFEELAELEQFDNAQYSQGGTVSLEELEREYLADIQGNGEFQDVDEEFQVDIWDRIKEDEENDEEVQPSDEEIRQIENGDSYKCPNRGDFKDCDIVALHGDMKRSPKGASFETRGDDLFSNWKEGKDFEYLGIYKTVRPYSLDAKNKFACVFDDAHVDAVPIKVDLYRIKSKEMRFQFDHTENIPKVFRREKIPCEQVRMKSTGGKSATVTRYNNAWMYFATWNPSEFPRVAEWLIHPKGREAQRRLAEWKLEKKGKNKN